MIFGMSWFTVMMIVIVCCLFEHWVKSPIKTPEEKAAEKQREAYLNQRYIRRREIDQAAYDKVFAATGKVSLKDAAWRARIDEELNKEFPL